MASHSLSNNWSPQSVKSWPGHLHQTIKQHTGQLILCLNVESVCFQGTLGIRLLGQSHPTPWSLLGVARLYASKWGNEWQIQIWIWYQVSFSYLPLTYIFMETRLSLEVTTPWHTGQTIPTEILVNEVSCETIHALYSDGKTWSNLLIWGCLLRGWPDSFMGETKILLLLKV